MKTKWKVFTTRKVSRIIPLTTHFPVDINIFFPSWQIAQEEGSGVVVVVFLGFLDKPRMYYNLAGLLYRPIWTFQVGPPDASTPADVSRTPCLHACRRVPHFSSGSWNFMGGEMKPNFA
jgi:hypothetical protein